jgi:hypothetical protein
LDCCIYSPPKTKSHARHSFKEEIMPNLNRYSFSDFDSPNDELDTYDRVIIIKKQFNGPPKIANGGYVSGMLAKFIDGSAEMILRQPTPLEKLLKIRQLSEGKVALYDEDKLLVEARPVAGLDLEVPEPPSYAEAVAASQNQSEHEKHPKFDKLPFPDCFVCGPNRDPANGLCIFPGKVGERNLIAAPWLPGQALADINCFVRPEFVWAALDCPGGLSTFEDEPRPIVLGKITAELYERVRPGEKCIAVGWHLAQEGRKHSVGSAVFSEAGVLYGKAKATWIEVDW